MLDAEDGEEQRQAGARDRKVPDVRDALGVGAEDERKLVRRQGRAAVDGGRLGRDRVDLGLREGARGREGAPAAQDEQSEAVSVDAGRAG